MFQEMNLLALLVSIFPKSGTIMSQKESIFCPGVPEIHISYILIPSDSYSIL